MKKIFFLSVSILVYTAVFSQQKLSNGIYLVDGFAGNRPAAVSANRAVIQFNPGTTEEDKESYDSVIVITDGYFPFYLAGQPVIQNETKDNSQLLLQLTDEARQKLKTFTTSNMQKNIAVVINDEALVVYKITTPVTGGLIKVARCNGKTCNQILKNLKRPKKI